MGYFSWKYCDVKTNDNSINRVIIGKNRYSYVLIPKEFGGGHIVERCYDGYGRFGGKDIYELVAEWNRAFLSEELLGDKPKLEDFGGLCLFEKNALRKDGFTEEEIEKRDTAEKEKFYREALEERKFIIARLNDYKNGAKDEVMEKKYGPDWKRKIGIDIACYDEQNAAIPYPIKIAICEKSVYEEEGPSLRDPEQGCW